MGAFCTGRCSKAKSRSPDRGRIKALTATAIHGVRLNVANLDRAQQFYAGTRHGRRHRHAPGRPPRWVANCSGGQRPRPESRAPDLSPCAGPTIPTCICVWSHPTRRAAQRGWPKSVDQLGSTVLTLLVADLDAEMRRLVDDGASIRADAAYDSAVDVARHDPPTSRIRRETLSSCSNARRAGVGTYAACTVVGAQTDVPAPPTQHVSLRSDVRLLCRFRIRPGSAERRTGRTSTTESSST